jgi:ring-1,2-phenylacetyl-CoA epoxidase subunit PaaC
MNNKEALMDYVLRLADNNLILGQRLSEWCGHAPELETDIALTNIALDLIGQSRSLYQYAAELEGKGRTEDDMAYFRDCKDYKNVLLVEQPNEDFAYTIARQFFFDVYNYLFYKELTKSKDETLTAVAEKSLKEITYHLRFSSEWMIRLGDGTELSHKKIQTAVDDLWDYIGEMTFSDEIDEMLLAEGIAVDLNRIRQPYFDKVKEILNEATLACPNEEPFQKGGKQGRHSEFMGHILAEMQWMQRAYPGAEW